MAKKRWNDNGRLQHMRWQASKALVAMLETGRPFEINMSFETSKNRGWAICIRPDPEGPPGTIEFAQSRYVRGPEAKKRRSRAYWRMQRSKITVE